MECEGLARSIRDTLSSLTTRLPRRAVVCGGVVCDKTENPREQEVVALSSVCEAVRIACKEPVYSRQTASLLRQCLEENSPEAWRCLLDDQLTGDLDMDAIAFAFSDCTASLRLVQCFVGAQSGTHLWLVVKAAHMMRSTMSVAAIAELAASFQRVFGDLVVAVSCRFKDVSSEMRATAITSLGALMTWTGIPIPVLASMLDACATTAQDDVLRLFLTAPVPQLAAHAPGLVDKLLTRAERAQQASRYPSCALLAALSPEQLKAHEQRVSKLARRTVDIATAQGEIDIKLALVCGVLAKAVAPPRSLESSLAHALCCCVYAQLSVQPPKLG